jgi:hypothetical protein
MRHGPTDPPAVVRQHIDLAQLECDIRSEFEAARGSQWDAVESWFRLGGLLAEVREALPHGNKKGPNGERLGGFGSWVAKRNLPFGVRQAEKYIRLHEQERPVRAAINANWGSGFPDDVTINELLGLVSEERPEEPDDLPEGPAEAYPQATGPAEEETPGGAPPGGGAGLEPVYRVYARVEGERQERWPRLARDAEAVLERARRLQYSRGPADPETRTRVVEQLRSLAAQLEAAAEGLEASNRQGRPRGPR